MMTHLNFLKSNVDQAVFFCRNGKSVIIVLVHIDDCTITASSMALISDFKLRITKHVEIIDLGELHWLLGIEVKRNCECRTIHLSQQSYLKSIPWRYGLYDLKPVSIPMDMSIHLTTAHCPSTTADFALMKNTMQNHLEIDVHTHTCMHNQSLMEVVQDHENGDLDIVLKSCQRYNPTRLL